MPEGQLLVLADHAHPVRVQGRPYYRDKRLAVRVNQPLPQLGSWPTPYPSFGEWSDAPADPEAMTSPGWEEPDTPVPPRADDAWEAPAIPLPPPDADEGGHADA